MPRIRSVHPDICTDETLARVSAPAERLFVRLWTHLDDEGRCIDNPKLLKAALFPLHDDVGIHHISLWLDELVEVGCLFRYQAVDKSYLTAKRTWKIWQKPRHPTTSKFPTPPDQVFTAERRTATAERREPHAGVVVGVERRGDGTGEEGECEGEVEQPAAGPVLVDNLTGLELRTRALGERLAHNDTPAPWTESPATNPGASHA